MDISRNLRDYRYDPLFGIGGFFFFPLGSSLASYILSTLEDLKKDFSAEGNSSEFLELYIDVLSGAENFVYPLIERGLAYIVDEETSPPLYYFSYEVDEKNYEAARQDFIPKKLILEQWPLSILIMSAIFRCYVEECCPYTHRLWNLILMKQSADPQTDRIKALLNVGLFDEALLLLYSRIITRENLEEMKKTKVSSYFWSQIFDDFFFNPSVKGIAKAVLKEFLSFAKRNPSFEVEYPNLRSELLFVLNRVIGKPCNSVDLAFLKEQSLRVLEILGVDSEEALAGLNLAIENKSIENLRKLLEKTCSSC